MTGNLPLGRVVPTPGVLEAAAAEPQSPVACRLRQRVKYNNVHGYGGFRCPILTLSRTHTRST
jgi:hypothetical protein